MYQDVTAFRLRATRKKKKLQLVTSNYYASPAYAIPSSQHTGNDLLTKITLVDLTAESAFFRFVLFNIYG